MTRRRALWLIAVVTLLAVAFYLWGSSHTPNGQPPLVSLDPRNVANFQQSFDASAADARLVLLLSPT
jgi:hypothetical protein